MFSLRFSLKCIIAIIRLAASVPTGLGPRDVSQDVLDRFNLFEQYSAAAYCQANDNATKGTDIACATGNCPLVQQADATSIYSFSDTGIGDVTGLLALDHTNELIVLAFRGSRSVQNWIVNIDYELTNASSLCETCQVHKGFLDSWQSVSVRLTSELFDTVSANSGYKIVFTGHSLGAALATIAAVQLRNAGNSIDLYTYGSPRVGNIDFATFLTSQPNGTNYRVTHGDDPVPKLPLRAMGFSHPSPEYWITAATNESVTAAEISVIEGIDSNGGNDGTNAGLDIPAHLWYFNEVSSCQ